MPEITGRCLCGAVAFTASPETRDVAACHCGMCRRWCSGPFFCLEGGGQVRFTGEENIKVYRSSDQGERGFCQTCGSSLFWKTHGKEAYALSAGALDSNDGLTLTSQIFMRDKPAFYDFVNETRKSDDSETVPVTTANREDE